MKNVKNHGVKFIFRTLIQFEDYDEKELILRQIFLKKVLI